MEYETELKLTITDSDAELLDHLAVVTRYAQGPAEKKHLLNCYYDTPACDLWSSHMALRVRQDGNRFIQTLKTGGQSISGLVRRGEWEWNLTDDRLQPDKIPAELWPEAIQGHTDKLAPIFRTDFYRTGRRLMIPAGELGDLRVDCHIELALDQGEATLLPPEENRRRRISEVELELKAGEATMLTTLADIMRNTISLLPRDVSKAAVGYRLLSLKTE
ncbi:MAG: CYTH domain-containing protein [Deltaproteobacteria bacterium]|nr:CYTH domain-containing protein [Deltaproteobacteria bacterium]